VDSVDIFSHSFIASYYLGSGQPFLVVVEFHMTIKVTESPVGGETDSLEGGETASPMGGETDSQVGGETDSPVEKRMTLQWSRDTLFSGRRNRLCIGTIHRLPSGEETDLTVAGETDSLVG
jgi:hypothetical protein